MNQLLAVMGALSDRNRVRAVAACLQGELCVCQITELLRLAPSTVSKHLWILRQAGLLESRKQGRWIFYRLPDDVHEVARNALALLKAAMKNDREILVDRKQLKAILKMDPETLCQRQRNDSECCSSALGIPAAARSRRAGLAGSRAK